MVTEGVQYSGLTKFEISHESKDLFRLEILDGVGSVGCSQIVLFKDSPEDFEEKQNQQNEEIGIQANVLDYTDTKFLCSPVTQFLQYLSSHLVFLQKFFLLQYDNMGN